MSESDIIATPPHEPEPPRLKIASMTRKTGCARPSSARCSTPSPTAMTRPARALVADLHPADIADLIELAPGDERVDLIEALAGIVDADVYAELND